jgi:hypothetical protein
MAYTPTFLAAKMLGISYVTVLYFFLGLGVAKGFDALYGEFNKHDYEETGKNRSLVWLTADILFHIVLLAVVFYTLRNIVERIPFPLDGLGGYQHHRLKELEGGPVLEFVGLFFQRNLKKKSYYFMKRVFGDD